MTTSTPSSGSDLGSFVHRVLAPNAGPMTLDGTNSYLIGAGAGSGDGGREGRRTRVVVDPGPSTPSHLAELARLPVELVLLTHHHADHIEAAAEFARQTGAPVRAIDPALCRDAPPLVDGEVIDAAGVELRVLATPGHTADSVCFVLPDAGEDGAVLTGDTILGRGTTIIADPDGALRPYLASLERLRALGHLRVLPGHGPELPDLVAICDTYLAHRATRLDELRAAIAALTARGEDVTVTSLVDTVYADSDASVRPAAEASVRAQLAYLREPSA